MSIISRIKKHNRKTSEVIDEWLESKGLYRKHTARDGSCLFRAVAEQVFHTQVLHMTVRQSCVRYMEDHKEKYSVLVDGSFENYIYNLRNPKEWAGQVEMEAMSDMFKRDFLAFRDVASQPCLITNNGFKEKSFILEREMLTMAPIVLEATYRPIHKCPDNFHAYHLGAKLFLTHGFIMTKFIMLCQSPGNHYDSVYPRNFVVTAAFCQSVVYEILYKTVFQFGDEVDLAVEKMLHDKVYAKHRKDSTASHDSSGYSPESCQLLEVDILGGELKEGASDIRRALAMGIPPFPYKVAKALDPNIYRNVEFDIWNEIKKDEPVFEPGVKCLVRLSEDQSEVYHAHIQEVGRESDPVIVYVEELGVKCDVHYNQLEQLPSPVKKIPWSQPAKPCRALSMSACYPKSPFKSMHNEDDINRQKRKALKGKPPKDFTFPISIPQSPGLLPRMQTSQEPLVHFGRGSLNVPSYNRVFPRYKWSQSGNYNQRMFQQQQGNLMNRFNSCGDNSAFPGIGNDQNHNAEDSYPSCEVQNRESNFQTVSGQMTWMKSMQNSNPRSTGHFDQGQHGHNAGNSSCHIDNNDNRPFEGGTSSSLGPSPTSTCEDVGPTPEDGNFTTSDAHYSHDIYLTQQGHCEPMSFCQYPLVPGLLVPIADGSGTPVNYNALRSQDVGGNDLPLLDLPTLRFFYNLGHDYFRMSTLVHLPQSPPQTPYPPAYTVWQCNQYSPANDGDLATNHVADSSNRDHPPHNVHMPIPYQLPVPLPVTADGTGTTIMCAKSTFPNSDDNVYCTSSIPGDQRSNLVLDDQGVLTISNNSADDVAASGNNMRPQSSVRQRCRSDSGESSGSWRSVREPYRSSRQKPGSGPVPRHAFQRRACSPFNNHEPRTSLCTPTNNGQQRGYVHLLPNEGVPVPAMSYQPRFNVAQSPMAGPFMQSPGPTSLSVSVGYYGPSAGSGVNGTPVPPPATSTPQGITPMYAAAYYSPQPCIYHQPAQQIPFLSAVTHNPQ